MNEILNDLGSKWKDLNSTQKSGIAEAIAGKNHINTLQALMNNWDTVLQYQRETIFSVCTEMCIGHKLKSR